MRDAGADFLDAPVSGGVEGAKNGKLSIMVGGEADTLARARPALDTYGARVLAHGRFGRWAGDQGGESGADRPALRRRCAKGLGAGRGIGPGR
jgi:6-phosphogluconate dehydrogenase (decarboxylating)